MALCDGRVVIVTGGARGIGREHSLAFAREGAKVVVNNAGILRDRMFVNTSIEEWDAVVRVHRRGHFCTSRHAAEHWLDRIRAGESVDVRIINTGAGAGLQGSIGQSNYVAAKAGIAELRRYGITANCIAPSARTRLTEGVFKDMMKHPVEGFDAMDPANVSPLVVWLGSKASADVTGRCFEVEGGRIGVADGWRTGPGVDKNGRWEPIEIGDTIRDRLEESEPPQKVYGT
ncbi:MAG: short-chain dehydrogenase [Deltaproteobacteria bacterium]|jgi:NAD(P)-dependent dehydrogenase (short-subunit alcohol dehydrogenase family)|nr:short-chain dehydrogenase [Deltaproteobacteria bacterium]